MLCVEVPVYDVGMSSEMPVSFSSSFFSWSLRLLEEAD